MSSCSEWWNGLSSNQRLIFIVVVALLVIALFFTFNNCSGNKYPDDYSGGYVPRYVTDFWWQKIYTIGVLIPL